MVYLKLFSTLFIFILFNSCNNEEKDEIKTQFNLITPSKVIYSVEKRNVSDKEIKNNYYEKCFYSMNKLIRIERYSPQNTLTDDLSVAAITKFEYDGLGNLRYISYYDKNKNRSNDKIFGYSSIEYVYDELERVKIEIYRDKKLEFLKLPPHYQNNITLQNFLAPILTYEYKNNEVFVKAFDENFNLLKETEGNKPCIPFIDCGENE